MKKTIITLAAIMGISGAAFAQGSINLQTQSTAGGVSATTTATSTSSWYTGALSVEIFAQAASGNTAADVAAVNADWGSPTAALALLAADGWVQQTINGNSTISSPTTGGAFSDGSVTIGSAGTITTGNSYSYAIVGIAGSLEGVLAWSAGTSGAPAPGNPINDNSVWPNQNLFLTSTPEPTTLAFAGLGGLSMLLLRRRNS